uniref:Uncharacterized protein n=1 Tax=Rhizophora mucronata TaxID=61149 RepID=A0A2P2P009_RHIMU
MCNKSLKLCEVAKNIRNMA